MYPIAHLSYSLFMNASYVPVGPMMNTILKNRKGRRKKIGRC